MSTRRPDLVLIDIIKRKRKERKRTCCLVNFAVPADHTKWKSKESEKIDKYLDFARELKNLELSPEDWNSWRLKEESQLSRLQNCWDWSEYWEEPRRLEETCCHSDSSENSSAYVDVKNSPRVKYFYQLVKK